MIKLYGTEKCHKTNYYKIFLETRNVDYAFLDIRQNEANEEELRNLYENRKLNFPTITILNKKLRNPSDKELQKQIDRL
jgi:arsenate reductase-like glutaredoxin family protein